MQTIVLAGTSREVYAWARAQERSLRSVRHAPNAASIQGRNFDKIVELPSFSKRRDRHAVMAAVKRIQRSVRGIPYELDEDWVMPAPRVRVERHKLDPKIFLFSNAPVDSPVSDHKQAAIDWMFAQVNDSLGGDGPTAEAGEIEHATLETTYVSEERPPYDEGGLPSGKAEVQNNTGEIEKITEGMQQVADDLSTLATSIEADPDQEGKYDAIVATDKLGSDAPSPRPKRKGRRTNEQKAYDEALDAWENNGGKFEDVVEAREAVAKRHPDDERLSKDIPGDPRNAEPDLDF